MEPLFENRHIRNKAMFQEFGRYSMLHNPATIIFSICTVALLHLTVSDWFANETLSINYLFYICILWGSFIFVYYRSVDLSVKRELELNHGQPMEQHFFVNEDGFTAQGPSGGTTEVSFDTIKKVRQTKHLILLCTKTKLFWAFPKQTFTKGTPEEFLAFLKAKGFRVK